MITKTEAVSAILLNESAGTGEGERQETEMSETAQNSGEPTRATKRQRALLAEFVRVWRKRISDGDGEADVDEPPVQGSVDGPPMTKLSPRERQTLEFLLAGEGEKQIANQMKLSQHTVHGYVKSVYRRFGVNSRAELLSLWVRRRGNRGITNSEL